jgi:hypothetical protein
MKTKKFTRTIQNSDPARTSHALYAEIIDWAKANNYGLTKTINARVSDDGTEVEMYVDYNSLSTQ